MNAYSKHAWAVFALSLFASTASASIPDANGVIHGCYNALTGATRIIDGTTCGLLEKAVTWSQTGPRGPAGASVTGVSLPVGDANCPTGGVALTLSNNTSYICNGNTVSQSFMGWDQLSISGSIPTGTSKRYYFPLSTFTPAVNGASCAYTVNASFLNSSRATRITPVLATHQETQPLVGMDYARVGFHGSDQVGDSEKMSTSSVWTNMQAGVDYKLGVEVGVAGDPFVGILYIWATWNCTGGPNLTPN